MYFQPAIIALLLLGGLGTLGLMAAAPYAWDLARRWDPASGDRRQIRRERRMELMSALLSIVLVAQAVALLLFVFTVDRLAPQFVGAMCAVGTLQVNRWGFPALGGLIAVYFAIGVWRALDRADRSARGAPLVRLKYALVLGLGPLLAFTFALQLRFFGALDADVITSCCGSLFSGTAPSVTSQVAALPVGPARLGFVAATSVAIAANAGFARWRRGGAWAGASSAAAFLAGLAGVMSFVAPAVYGLPDDHCPFCLLDAGHGAVGYALYLPLFFATRAGLAAGALSLLRARPGFAPTADAAAARLAGQSAVGFLVFAAVAAALVWRSSLVLVESGGA